MEPIPPQPGSSIDPSHAVGRRQVTEVARRELLRDNNLALTDPRRMGKTVWLDLFCADPGPGLSAVKVDYEGVKTTEEFLTRTLTALRAFSSLPKRARAGLTAFFDGWEVGVGPLSVKPALAHKSKLEMLTLAVDAVADAMPEETRLVIAMDEVPMAIDNISSNEGPDAAGQLLQTLRTLRRNQPKLGWIVCGSIGFHHVLRRCRVTEGVINDLVNLPLGPFTDIEARELAHRLTLGIERPATMDVTDLLAQRAGHIPFLIHALAHQLEDMGTGPLTQADVEQAFDDFVHDRDASRAVTHLVTRLDQYGDRASLAERVLDLIALQGATPDVGLVGMGDLGSVVDDLIDDHYLTRTADGLAWRYEVLRIVWVTRRNLA